MIIGILVLGTGTKLWGQYAEHLQKARALFTAGNYEGARKSLSVYTKMTGTTESALFRNIEDCILYKQKAEEARKTKQYRTSQFYYELILKKNPRDSYAKREVQFLQELEKVSLKTTTREGTKDRVYRVGDSVQDGASKYAVCYLDATKEHGWMIIVEKRQSKYDGARYQHVYGENRYLLSKGWRVANKDEVYQIYRNRYALGLNQCYMTLTRSKKVGGYFFWGLDFSTGKYKSIDKYKGSAYPHIYIKNF
ncbi:MAG: hypothetical protein NC324_01910 [Bacteroides sp.]|nr:hypothetical protein [Bacteroides sp.]